MTKETYLTVAWYWWVAGGLFVLGATILGRL